MIKVSLYRKASTLPEGTLSKILSQEFYCHAFIYAVCNENRYFIPDEIDRRIRTSVAKVDKKILNSEGYPETDLDKIQKEIKQFGFPCVVVIAPVSQLDKLVNMRSHSFIALGFHDGVLRLCHKLGYDEECGLDSIKDVSDVFCKPTGIEPVCWGLRRVEKYE